MSKAARYWVESPRGNVWAGSSVDYSSAIGLRQAQAEVARQRRAGYYAETHEFPAPEDETYTQKLKNWLPYGIVEHYSDDAHEISIVKVHARAYRVSGTVYDTDLGETTHATLGMARRRVRGYTDSRPTMRTT